MATPGITFPLLLVELATIPARPPKNAIKTSYTVGWVRANNSLCASLIGEIRKKSVEVITLNTVAVAKLRKARLIRSKSEIANPRPNPIIGPIKGDINMAPLITAVELIFKPKEATNVAKIRTHRFVPLKSIPFLTDSIVSSSFSFSWRTSKLRTKKSLICLCNSPFSILLTRLFAVISFKPNGIERIHFQQNPFPTPPKPYKDRNSIGK